MTYGEYINNTIWQYICNDVARRQYNYKFKMRARGYGKTYAKTLDSRALFAELFGLHSTFFDTTTISLLWCEYFVIPNYKGQKNKIILAKRKIPRYIRKELTT